MPDRIVMMRGGKILQIGSPEDIYQRPQSPEVAIFFGTPNLLPARVVASVPSADGAFVVSVEGEGWSGQVRGGEKFFEGQSVLVLVRPENVDVAQTTHPDAESWVQ